MPEDKRLISSSELTSQYVPFSHDGRMYQVPAHEYQSFRLGAVTELTFLGYAHKCEHVEKCILKSLPPQCNGLEQCFTLETISDPEIKRAVSKTISTDVARENYKLTKGSRTTITQRHPKTSDESESSYLP